MKNLSKVVIGRIVGFVRKSSHVGVKQKDIVSFANVDFARGNTATSPQKKLLVVSFVEAGIHENRKIPPRS